MREIVSGGNDIWDSVNDTVGDVGSFIERHKDSLITIALEVGAVVLSIITIVTILGATITVGPAILLGIAILGVAYSVNIIVDSGARIGQSEQSGKKDEDCDGYNIIKEKVIMGVGGLNEGEAKKWYEDTFTNPFKDNNILSAGKKYSDTFNGSRYTLNKSMSY